VPNSPGAGRKLQPGPGCGCHGYTATTLRAAVLLRRMSLSRSRVFPGVCTKAHEGVFQGAPRGGAHTSPPNLTLKTREEVGIRGYKDGLQPESLADGNWLVKKNQPVSKIETESDTMVTMGGDLQPGSLADRLLTGLGQPQINP